MRWCTFPSVRKVSMMQYRQERWEHNERQIRMLNFRPRMRYNRDTTAWAQGLSWEEDTCSFRLRR